MKKSKIIKRYANRKLYDTDSSCYVTLEDISQMIKAGDEVQVIDNRSGDNLTSITLAQIIFETEKKKKFMPLGLLRDLIQQSGDAIGGIAREGVDKVQATALKLKDSLVGDKLDWMMQLKNTQGEGRGAIISDLAKVAQSSLEDLQKGVEELLKAPVEAVSTYTHLTSVLSEIKKRLLTVENQLAVEKSKKEQADLKTTNGSESVQSQLSD